MTKGCLPWQKGGFPLVRLIKPMRCLLDNAKKLFIMRRHLLGIGIYNRLPIACGCFTENNTYQFLRFSTFCSLSGFKSGIIIIPMPFRAKFNEIISSFNQVPLYINKSYCYIKYHPQKKVISKVKVPILWSVIGNEYWESSFKPRSVVGVRILSHVTLDATSKKILWNLKMNRH